MATNSDHIRPVVENLLAFVDRMCQGAVGWITDRSGSDFSAYSSDIPFPLFNLVAGARFVAERDAISARKVADGFIERGVPWMWWVTPSKSSPVIEQTLADMGLSKESVPGMFAELRENFPSSTEIEIVEVPPGDPGFGEVLVKGFGLPAFIKAPFQEMLGAFSPAEQTVKVAREGDRVLAVATGFITGDTLGIYNVVTLEEARGRGLGTAVTSAVLGEGRLRGCTNAILHTSAIGRPIYERLGFEVVCPTAQWVWGLEG